MSTLRNKSHDTTLRKHLLKTSSSKNDEEYRLLKARIDADCDRIAAEYAREREKRKEKAKKKPRKVSLKKYIESERCVPVIPKAVA